MIDIEKLQSRSGIIGNSKSIREVLDLCHRTMWDDQFDLIAKCDFENSYVFFSHISR